LRATFEDKLYREITKGNLLYRKFYKGKFYKFMLFFAVKCWFLRNDKKNKLLRILDDRLVYDLSFSWIFFSRKSGTVDFLRLFVCVKNFEKNHMFLYSISNNLVFFSQRKDNQRCFEPNTPITNKLICSELNTFIKLEVLRTINDRLFLEKDDFFSKTGEFFFSKDWVLMEILILGKKCQNKK